VLPLPASSAEAAGSSSSWGGGGNAKAGASGVAVTEGVTAALAVGDRGTAVVERFHAKSTPASATRTTTPTM
jgi:hypothetical protein